MPREKETYRDNLEMLLRSFPDKKLLNKQQVADYLGIDRRTATKRFTFKDNLISIATLARELS